MSPGRLRRRATLLAAAALGLVGLGAVSWSASDRVERENSFCLSCHLTPEVRLHDAVGRDFAERPPASLAARHAEAEADFRCIDCHGGTSWPGRLRVKLSAASDAFWYVSGHFDEPDRMTTPLWDEDCRKCHPSLGEKHARDWDSISFHEVVAHRENLGVACVDCHRVHDTDVDPEASFLHAGHVREQCASCHSDFRDEE
jgi:nitrate/TMAO reductase-like tetraheme cytochrome c subunit